MTYDPIVVRTPGRLLGVCADLSAVSGINATLIRILAVVAMICAFKLTLVTYCVGALAFRAQRR